jgi:hypothetical protein
MRRIISVQSLISKYPQFHKGRRSSPLSKTLTDVLFATSCEILEHSHEIITDPETTAWTWMLQTYVQWHPVAYLLNELCTSPQHPQAPRAWRAIDYAFTISHGLTFEANMAI